MLSKRLEAVASFVHPNAFCIDVGCDHALLDIYLANKYDQIRLIASDINDKPLLQAKKNIDKYCLNKRILIRNGSGLDPITDEVDTIIIAGMGGNNIVKILTAKEKLKNIKQIIISSNNNEYLVKTKLKKYGFYLQNEVLVLDKKIIYIIMNFTKNKKKYSRSQLKYGTDNLKQDIDLYHQYLNQYLIKYLDILKNIPKKHILKRFLIKKEIINLKNL